MVRKIIFGAETGDSSEISSLGAGFSIDGTVARTGAYSLKNDATGSGDMFFDVGSANAVARPRARTYIRLNANSGANQDIVLFDFFNPSVGHQAQVTLGRVGTTFRIDALDGAFALAGTVSLGALSTGQWYRIEADLTPGAGTGALDIYLDGALVLSLTSQQFGTGGMEFLKIGPSTGTPPGAGFEYWIDDAALDTAALCGDGKIIARQFKAGTPTFDTWTKSSGTIDTVWDDTPFSAASNASTQLGSTQSALLSSFSAPQTGHGTDFAASESTLTGIKVGAVAKASGTAGLGITQVGNILATSSLNGANITLTFSTAPSPGDVVIVWGGHTSTRPTPIGPSTAGYTQLGTTQTATTNTFGVWYKIMGATPDTTVVGQGTGNASDSTGYGCIVLRGVEAAIVDAAIAFANGSSTNPDAPSVTPAVTGAVTLICAGTVANDSAWTSPANYGATVAAGSNDTNPYSIGGALRSSFLTGGVAENPAAWSGVVTGVWIAATIAVKWASHAQNLIGMGTIAAGFGTDVTLTTSDAYYEQYFSAPSLAALNADEFQVLHGDTLAIQTVEDAWVMLDYVPSTFTWQQLDADHNGNIAPHLHSRPTMIGY